MFDEFMRELQRLEQPLSVPIDMPLGESTGKRWFNAPSPRAKTRSTTFSAKPTPDGICSA